MNAVESLPLSIKTIPHPVLREVATWDESLTREALYTLSDTMTRLMYKSKGVGLAAPQVGLPLRMFVMDISQPMKVRNSLAVLNPQILWTGLDRAVMREGCLSIPKTQVAVKRPTTIFVAYSQLNGLRVERTLTGFQARVFQHELDHLDGILITDYSEARV